jgi:serine/threonine-protein kinase
VISDFGIALAVGVAGGGRLTETGLSLGTPHYVSPEQATGDLSVGAATDVYALGCVLYEMLVGEPPYTGSTAQAILGKIIAGEVASATKHRRSVPANVDAAIRKSLEKVSADRFTGTNAFAEALGDPRFRHGELVTAGVAASGRGQWTPLAVATTALALLFGTVGGWGLFRPEPPLPVARFSSPFEGGQEPRDGGMEATPDGSALVYTGPGPGGEGSQLWIRRWGSLSSTPIPGTERARGEHISLSPDGREVAFTLGNPAPLRIVPLEGGPGRTLVEAASGVGGWSEDGWVYFQNASTSIQRVRATGGDPEVLTERTEGEVFHRLPQLLPGGRAVVFQVFRDQDGTDSEIWSLNLETRERAMLIRGNSPRYVTTGHLLFGTPDGRLMAAPFSVEKAELTGSAVPVAEGLSNDPLRGVLHYSVSGTGALVYRAGEVAGQGHELVWVTRSGQATPVDQGPLLPPRGIGNYGWRLSPDETRIVFNSVVDGNDDVRIKHLPEGPVERLTFSADQDFRPFWTPDGQSVTYFSGPTREDRNVWSTRADGTGEPMLILDDERTYVQGAWSPDGEWLVLRATGDERNLGLRDILSFRPGIDSAAAPLVTSAEFQEHGPALSPNGRWLAYSSDETGRHEVFVRPFPDVAATRVRVSVDGAYAPVWAKSGRELFFVGAERELVATQFDPASGRSLAQETLFTTPDGYLLGIGNNFYDVSTDGERFLMARPYVGDREDVASRFVLVQNFFEELKRLVPPN